MKRVMLVGLMASFCFADYYTIANVSLSGNKEFIFDDVSLKVDRGDLSLSIQNELIDTKGLAKRFKDITLKFTKEVPNPKYDPLSSDEEIPKTIKVTQNKTFKVVNFEYILKNNIDDKEFFLKTDKYLFMIKQNIDEDKIKLFNDKKDVTVYSYEVIAKYDFKNKLLDKDKREFFSKYLDEDGLVGIKIDDKMKHLVKITSKDLDRFLKELKTRELKVKKFDFSNTKLYLSYINKGSDVKRLNITYEMKKKNIKTVLTSPISLFDPENKSEAIEQNVGFLRELGDLYELKKVQIIDREVDVDWLNLPNKRFVALKYKNEGKMDKNILSKSKNQQFYGIEGLFYLPYFMSKNGIDKKVFTFINGSLPFDVTIKKVSNRFVVSKSGKTIYEFILDERGFVKDFRYPLYDVEIKLESVESDITRENRRFLKDFMNKFDIIKVKD